MILNSITFFINDNYFLKAVSNEQTKIDKYKVQSKIWQDSFSKSKKN